MDKNKQKYKICNKCNQQVPFENKNCDKCNFNKFRPSFVEKRVNITKNFSVNIMPHFSIKNKKIINLYKWFPGRGSWKININNEADWEKISSIIENDLGPLIGWKTKKDLVKEIEKTTKNLPTSNNEIALIAKGYPELVAKILKALDFTNLGEKNHKIVLEMLTSIGKVIERSDEGFQISFRNIIQNLPSQEKMAIVELEELLKDWSLKQITGVTSIVKERLNELKRFEIAISKDTTFEIRGDGSIHRILERAMWILDERYWLLNSNETIRKIIGDQIVKINKKDENKRPDFVCGTVDNKFIIVELKRPSHNLTVADLNQLENYLKIIEPHTEYKVFEAYLIGKKRDPELDKTLKYRRTEIFKIRTFADLIDDTKKRYLEYLNIKK